MSYVRFPTKITAGVTFKQSFNLTAYPATGGWSLVVYLRGATSINMQSTADGNQHLFNISAETTKTYQAGHYSYSLRAVNISGEVEELDSGVLEIIADLSAINTTTDLRSHAQKTLAALEAVIEGRASLDQERYRINNRELYRTPLETLLKLRSLYRAEVAREQAKAKGKSLFGQVVRVTLE